MIRHQMPFQNLNPFIFAEALQNFFYTFTELCEDYFPSIFLSKDDMILAQPFRMRQAMSLDSHNKNTFPLMLRWA